jgi:hypothetical protein
MHPQSLTQSGIYLQICPNGKFHAHNQFWRTVALVRATPTVAENTQQTGGPYLTGIGNRDRPHQPVVDHLRDLAAVRQEALPQPVQGGLVGEIQRDMIKRHSPRIWCPCRLGEVVDLVAVISKEGHSRSVPHVEAIGPECLCT